MVLFIIEQVEEDTQMPYISLIERKGIKLGLEQGLEQGIEQGINRGRAATLCKLLQLKFGDLSDDYQARLNQGSQTELDLWTERVLFATTLEAVFEP